jgi:hypothetical protein
MTTLGGFGDKTPGPAVEGISRLGTWIVGSATIKGSSNKNSSSTKIGAYWKVF